MTEVSPYDIKSRFASLFPHEPLIVRSPGRINLIGEHTDYNDGFVMPAAIDKEIFFAVAASDSGMSTVYSFKYDEFFSIDVRNPAKVKSPLWANYLLGVLQKLLDEGYEVKPFNCVFGGNIPMGAGLSSSAAMECGFAYAISELNGLSIPKHELIHMAQWAEHNYAGVKCGIMDQFASMMSEEEKVAMLDCRSLDFTYFPLELSHHDIVLCNTNVKHSLVDSEYNIRRHECEEGVRIMRAYSPSIRSLRDVSPAEIEKHKNELPPKAYDRCLYVTQEIQRVRDASRDLLKGDIISFGKKMYETHDGLSRLYEVSCKELDFLVEQARQHGVTGARMMGGGFGGCTINLIDRTQVGDFIQSANDAYLKKFDLRMDSYVVQIKGGTSKISLSEKKFSIQ